MIEGSVKPAGIPGRLLKDLRRTAPDDLLETSVAARVLELTPGAVRLLNKQGRLVPALRTSRGWSFYFRRDVETLAEERRKRAAAATAGEL